MLEIQVEVLKHYSLTTFPLYVTNCHSPAILFDSNFSKEKLLASIICRGC